MSDLDWCDYCHDELPTTAYWRAVGFTDIDGDSSAPLVKTWCGTCEPGDQIDPAASAELKARFTPKEQQ